MSSQGMFAKLTTNVVSESVLVKYIKVKKCLKLMRFV